MQTKIITQNHFITLTMYLTNYLTEFPLYKFNPICFLLILTPNRLYKSSTSVSFCCVLVLLTDIFSDFT